MLELITLTLTLTTSREIRNLNYSLQLYNSTAHLPLLPHRSRQELRLSAALQPYRTSTTPPHRSCLSRSTRCFNSFIAMHARAANTPRTLTRNCPPTCFANSTGELIDLYIRRQFLAMPRRARMLVTKRRRGEVMLLIDGLDNNSKRRQRLLLRWFVPRLRRSQPRTHAHTRSLRSCGRCSRSYGRSWGVLLVP